VGGPVSDRHLGGREPGWWSGGLWLVDLITGVDQRCGSDVLRSADRSAQRVDLFGVGGGAGPFEDSRFGDSGRPAPVSHRTGYGAVLGQDLADYLTVPLATLYQWRYLGTGPTAYRVGRHLRYEPAAVQTWLEQQAQQQEHDHGKQ
jgi:hypothetical protein